METEEAEQPTVDSEANLRQMQEEWNDWCGRNGNVPPLSLPAEPLSREI